MPAADSDLDDEAADTQRAERRYHLAKVGAYDERPASARNADEFTTSLAQLICRAHELNDEELERVDIAASTPFKRDAKSAPANEARALRVWVQVFTPFGERGDPTARGFRSTFRDWAAEATNHPREVAEQALAHSLPDKVETAYRRGDLIDKRRRLMTDWATFCSRPASASDVVPIRATLT